MPQTKTIELSEGDVFVIAGALDATEPPACYEGRAWWDWPTKDVAEAILSAAVERGIVAAAPSPEAGE